MKKLFLIIAVAFIFPFLSDAQSVEIAPFGGYVFPGTLNFEGGEVYINGNAQYGGIISFAASRVIDIDLLYNRSDTKASVQSYNNYFSTYDVPLSINYMHFGFTKNFRVNTKVSPFVGLNFGACLFSPKEDYTDSWFFSMGLDAGAKIYFSKRIGIRLQGQMMIPYQGGGFTMYIGTGGTGGGVTAYTTLVQFGFTGGLIFRVGKVLY